MNELDIAGHVAYAILAGGMFLLSKKSKWGWILRFIGEWFWVVIGLLMGMTSIWFWGLIFMCIDMRGFYKWWRWEGRFGNQDWQC